MLVNLFKQNLDYSCLEINGVLKSGTLLFRTKLHETNYILEEKSGKIPAATALPKDKRLCYL